MSQYQRMCKRKRRYCTKVFAIGVAKQLLRKRPERPEMRPYKCPYCQGYHLTKCDKVSKI